MSNSSNDYETIDELVANTLTETFQQKLDCFKFFVAFNLGVEVMQVRNEPFLTFEINIVLDHILICIPFAEP